MLVRRMTRLRRMAGPVLLAAALAAGRLLMMAIGPNISTHGDFFATLPGAYVEALNPTLWNSEDLRSAWGFHQRLYFYGPTQYLTLYPIGLLHSYAQISIALS